MTYRIAIDCDEVLAETLDALLAYQNYTRKEKPLHREDVTNYHLCEIKKLHMSLDEEKKIERKFLLEDISIQTIQPVQGAKEVLQQRKKEGHTLYVVTGRSDPMKKNTNTRLQIHFPNIFDDIIFANTHGTHPKNKSDILKEKKIDYMIEDFPFYAEEIAQANIETFLLEKPRNKDFDHTKYPCIHKVKGRKDIKLVNLVNLVNLVQWNEYN
jgi:5'(3')-deoxyribonucleotidase